MDIDVLLFRLQVAESNNIEYRRIINDYKSENEKLRSLIKEKNDYILHLETFSRQYIIFDYEL